IGEHTFAVVSTKSGGCHKKKKSKNQYCTAYSSNCHLRSPFSSVISFIQIWRQVDESNFRPLIRPAVQGRLRTSSGTLRNQIYSSRVRFLFARPVQSDCVDI